MKKLKKCLTIIKLVWIENWFDNCSEVLENYLANCKFGYVSGLNLRSKYLLCILYKHKVNIEL